MIEQSIPSAESARETLSQEWVQNVFGAQPTDVLFEVLNEFIRKRAFAPLRTPLSQKEIRRKELRGDRVSGVVAVDLDDIIELDQEWFLDEISTRLTGTALLADSRFEVVGHDSDTLWLNVSGDAREIVEPERYHYYPEELQVFTQEEMTAVLAASEQNPWMDQRANEAVGHGAVLPVKSLDLLGRNVVIPEGILGTRRSGLFINGSLADVLHHFYEVLGELRIWRIWPDSNVAVVVPGPDYVSPMHDSLIMQLVQAVPLEEAIETT